MIVTISNQYGSGAIDVAAEAAAELGYEFVDRQLPVVVAKRMQISTAEAQAADETGRSLGARFLSGLELSTPEVATTAFGETFGDAYVREVHEIVREYAAHGNVVIVGRAAGVILGRRPDVVRVYMHAPREWRINRIVSEYGTQARVAAAEVDRIDRERAAHLRDWYGVQFGSMDLYDLAVDTASLGVHTSAAAIVCAARERA